MSGLYLGDWPPPESVELAGTGSASDDWPPPDPDERESADPDADAWYAPTVKAKPRQRPPSQPRAEPMGEEWQEAPKIQPIESTRPNAELLAAVELVEIDDYGQETVVPLE